MKVKNDLNIDWVIAGWLASNTYTGSNDGNYLSASGLVRSVRQTVLSKLMSRTNSEDPVDISTMLSSSIGTALHRDIQAVWEDENVIKEGLKALGFNKLDKIKVNSENPNEDDINLWFEKRVTKEINGWNITGQFDLVVNDTIHDFKSTSVYTYINKSKVKDYSIQLSVYRWLNPELITNDVHGVIHYIFTNWNKNFLHSIDGYPEHPFVSINVPLMSLQETEEMILKRIRDIEYYSENLSELPRCEDHTLMIDKPIWQYFASETSTKAAKNFENKLEALKYMQTKGKGKVLLKQQEPVGCKYCNCCSMCSQYREFIKTGVLKDDRAVNF